MNLTISLCHIFLVDVVLFIVLCIQLSLDVCPGIFSSGVQGLIIPNDLCVACKSVGAMVGNAVSPTIALDQAKDSSAIKMLPTTSEMTELLVQLINYTKWYDFIVLYDQDSGECKTTS